MSLRKKKREIGNTHQRYQDVLVCFSHDSTKSWQRFFKKGFAHCFIILRQDNGDWLFIEPMTTGISARTISAPGLNYVDILKRRLKIRVVKISEPEKCFAMISTPFFWFQSCTVWCKYMIGIRAPWAITPKQLYNTLMKKFGGVEL